MPYETIIDAATLAKNVSQPGWVVVDCRFDLGQPDFGRQAWEAATIPGAAFADLDSDLSSPVVPGVTGRHPLPDPDELAVTLGRFGIDDSSQVVVFDQKGGAFAARLWWMLRWLGHDAVAVLDGGLDAWIAGGNPTHPGKPPTKSAYFAPHPRRELLVTAAAVLGAAAADHVVVLDARAADRYRGENEATDPVAGHVPGARSAPFAGNLGADGRFLSPEALRARYEALLAGAASEQAICYCGSGVTACHDILAMAHAGLEPARLYPGSWSEWITDPARPVATGAEP